jgi:hypothetical protein
MARLETPAPAPTRNANATSKSTTKRKQTTTPLTKSDISDLVARQAARQKRPAIATFSLSVDHKIVPSIRKLSGASHFAFKVAEPAIAGSGTLTNVSKQPLTGRLHLRSIDAAGYARLTQARQEKAIADAVRSHRNPDLILILNHTLQRQLQSYPGGPSKYEGRAAAALKGVSPAALKRITDRLAPTLPSLAQRARDKSLTTLPIQQAVAPAAIASAAVAVDPSVLIPGAEVVKPDEDPDPIVLQPPTGVVTVDRPTSAAHRYNIRLIGIKSLHCADDVGWEYECDEEEPYVVWAAFGPGYARYGRTEEAHDVTDGDEFLYTQHTNVLSTDPEKPDAVSPNLPLLFLYQVIEADPDGPTRDEVLEVLKGGMSTAIAIYGEDYKSAFEQGAPTLVDTFVLLMHTVGGGDDLYTVKAAAFDAPRLLEVTSGDKAGPLDEDLFASAGDYDKHSIRVPLFRASGEKRFNLLYWVTRQ